MTTIHPISNIDDKSNLRTAINAAIRQVSDITGTITVAESGTIVLQNPKIYPGSVIVLSPRDTAASTARYYISTLNDGQAQIVITGTGIFDYVISGVR
ncbi:hypothetical protein EXN32_21905 [Agrobacterium tumefaciens]|uniref:hypothetical protein n=1 Tax=Agrobacterium TaxID=357 RepID=UPI00115DB237|nr:MULTISPECIES: hypothetical protein [Agrobacterium]MDA5241133.1 hypothetical protein [Agrobacterium sp. MAFF310724]MDA5249576.1 hypothetical protein [Agrobacterium sp. MAFF210268]TRB12361.1 hypothetical protein EXN32_21905 [Agrobacterium tumefaciens]